VRKKAPFSIEITPADIETSGAPNFLQSGFWAAFKSTFGWESRCFLVRCSGDDGHRIEIPLSVLLRVLPGGYTLAYIPHGPDPGDSLPGDPCDCLEYLSRALKPYLPKSCLFIRYDVPWGSWGEENFPKPLCRPLRRAPMDIQPPDTVVLSLEGDENSLLAAMKPKTRYNIRLAEKKGVQVREGSAVDLGRWYDLYRETAGRDGISLHGFAYYLRLFELAGAYPGRRPELRLLLAEAEDRLLAGIIIAVFGTQAFYLYGASSNEMRNYMASYLLQWRAMLLAKSLGARVYDLFGIPPRDDPGHAMYGLFRFKTGFGGRFLHRPGSYDFPLKFVPYLGYRAAEGLRKWYHKVWVKRFVKRRSL
jgi:lipid II:glycine glycyltransferase (peptidoglycan interpeptide bridge formation enzyme)